MYCFDCTEEWNQIHCDDLWIYNKLILSRVLGYNCGPSGVSVPKPDFYVVRPSLNLMGMGRYSRVEHLREHTEHLHPSEFWCEIFKGEHLSVDFHKKECILVVRGIREQNAPLYKWSRWEKIDKKVEFPNILNKLVGNYDWINCEFIGNRLIEVHFRRNSDFRHGNSVAIPIWDEKNQIIDSKYKYVEDSDYLRKGFYID
jgi:hypothetical protein